VSRQRPSARRGLGLFDQLAHQGLAVEWEVGTGPRHS
jgi:hypothetical protein